MTDSNPLYEELRPEFQLVATPLLQFSMECVKKRGDFLPHGGVLDKANKVQLCSAAPESRNGMASATEVLPLLHDGIRQAALDCNARVVGVAESVTVSIPGHKRSLAIKVLLEHRRGMTVAVYVRFKRKLFRGYVFERPNTIDAEPEVKPWPEHAAQVQQ